VPDGVVAVTGTEGGEWFPVEGIDMDGPVSSMRDHVFALKYENGEIWDPITGWRERSDQCRTKV
jgi:hypothetical protein